MNSNSNMRGSTTLTEEEKKKKKEDKISRWLILPVIALLIYFSIPEPPPMHRLLHMVGISVVRHPITIDYVGLSLAVLFTVLVLEVYNRGYKTVFRFALKYLPTEENPPKEA